MSHSNGFPIPPEEFKLIHGRDYPIIRQLLEVVEDRGIAGDVFSLDGVYDAWTTKAIIGNFDMLVSGRLHGAVSGLSQLVPTVLIDYGHEPRAHKLRGFARIAGEEEYLSDPGIDNDLINKIYRCWNSREEIRNRLGNRIPKVKELAKQNFKLVQQMSAQSKDITG